ncbi:MAG: helicase-related protein, partial [Planctomycetota bacterium]
ATRVVRADIARHLELEAWEDHLAGFDRENLFFKVTEVGGRNEKFDWIRAAREQMKGPGIVYAATRKNVELIAATLRMDRVPTLTYHGGMAAKDRTEAQERFMHGDIPLVIATNAFGMGIDKPDIRFVVHYDLPGSIESYYQEVGRAGRDGKPALCHLLFSYADVRIQEFFISESNPDPAAIHAAAGCLRAAFQPGGMVPSLDDVPGLTSDMARQSILHLFEQAGIIARLPEGDIFVAGPDRRQALAELIRHSAEKRANDEEKLAQMVAYAYNRGCRRNRILEYFGDVHEHPGCRACDRCLSPVARVTLIGQELDQARTALKAVHELRGRFGVEKTAQFLRGAEVAWLRTSQWRHAATCGSLADLKQDRISDLINELVAVGYCAVRLEDGRYPMLEITAAGAAVMRGEAECQLERTPAQPSPAPRPPKAGGQAAAKPPRRAKAAPSDIVNPDLYEALKAERTAVAAQKRLAPFKVLHDRTLQEMARLKPATLDDLAAIPGFGPVKLKKYGETFLRVISGHTH